MFAYRLGLQIGELDIEKMLDGLTVDQFLSWMAYYNVEPFGEERADLRSAIVACQIVNVNIPKGKKRAKVADFMPDFKPKKQQSVKEMAGIFRMFADAHNAAESKKTNG